MVAQNLLNPLGILNALGGYYECPKDRNGRRLGPLVEYAGKYQTSDGQKQYVGEVYANFSIAEQYPKVMKAFARWLLRHMNTAIEIDIVCGPQMGGFAIGQACASILECRFAYIEKVVLVHGINGKRESSYLEFLRHSIRPGDRVLLTEDVLNNFSTTKEAIELIEKHGGKVVCITGLLNRSENGIETYAYLDQEIPVISLVKKQFFQWEQEDPAVSKDIEMFNLVHKPKNEWPRLMKAMADAK